MYVIQSVTYYFDSQLLAASTTCSNIYYLVQPLLQLATRMTTCGATTLLGQLAAFNQEEETISAYLERTNIFFEANKIEEDKRCFLMQLVLKPMDCSSHLQR